MELAIVVIIEVFMVVVGVVDRSLVVEVEGLVVDSAATVKMEEIVDLVVVDMVMVFVGVVDWILVVIVVGMVV